jgi:hypothetical protein
MELGPILGLGLLYLVSTLIGKVAEAAKKQQGQGQAPRQPGARRSREVATRPAQRPSAPSTLEELLDEMRREMAKAQEREQQRLPSAEEVEERESLEVEERITIREPISLEEEVQVIDLDLEAERAAARRVAEAESRNRSWEMADHAAFDTRIRAKPTPVPTRPAGRVMRLREALVWREVLGPPPGLRD